MIDIANFSVCRVCRVVHSGFFETLHPKNSVQDSIKHLVCRVCMVVLFYCVKTHIYIYKSKELCTPYTAPSGTTLNPTQTGLHQLCTPYTNPTHGRNL